MAGITEKLGELWRDFTGQEPDLQIHAVPISKNHAARIAKSDPDGLTFEHHGLSGGDSGAVVYVDSTILATLPQMLEELPNISMD